jgi:hypothetical protein
VLASYLQPKMSDVELINALMSHFALHIQRSFVSVEITSIQDATNFLQRLKSIEGNDSYQESNRVHKPQATQNPHRFQQYHGNSRSKNNSNFVRQTFVSRPSQFNQQGRSRVETEKTPGKIMLDKEKLPVGLPQRTDRL